MKAKKTRKSPNLVTKTVLRDELDKALDRTKKELRVEIVIAKLDLKDEMKKMEERIDDKSRNYKDEILTKMDEVVGKFETKIQEDAAGTLRLQDHEERITRLESA